MVNDNFTYDYQTAYPTAYFPPNYAITPPAPCPTCGRCPTCGNGGRWKRTLTAALGGTTEIPYSYFVGAWDSEPPVPACPAGDGCAHD